ncbi:hypothetical protein GCM10011405_41300 [Rufibacter glacialis]|uniref:hypothetical protein n=1 Tax=Rufibacter glacialis TaxID=1259555 RepID=UPI00166CD510|nr:hypothetical protein [Rufibacter glacialis]GGK89282.1 hypothetical protein GCM10011405_41300 [Rufibacter glacialis]
MPFKTLFGQNAHSLDPIARPLVSDHPTNGREKDGLPWFLGTRVQLKDIDKIKHAHCK